jgi:chemotaxis signal transduction protein
VDAARRGGVVVRVEGELRFVAASLAVKVTPAPRVTPVPGAPPELVGIAVHEGQVVPVVAIGSARSEMIVCQHAGELLGIVGGEVVRTGTFDVVVDRPDLVNVAGQHARPLDVAAVYARVQAGVRPGRWG